MSVAHLERLRTELERRRWIIVGEHPDISEGGTLQWTISRPNGDTPLTIEFHPGFAGPHGDNRLDTLEDSIACKVVGHSDDADLYFGKFSGQYQKDVVRFVDAIERLAVIADN